MVGDIKFELANELNNPYPSLKFKKPQVITKSYKKEVVGDARFELATPWTQTKCATKLR